MFVKKKHILVILFSSLIVTVVFISTLGMYSIYMQWKKDTFASRYRNSIYKLTADIFRKEVIISGISMKIVDKGVFSGMSLVEGDLRNGTNKSVTSLTLEMVFTKPDGTVLYRDWVYPLGEKGLASPALLSDRDKTVNILLPGESMSFRHFLRNCPAEVTSWIASNSKFARSVLEDSIELVFTVEGMSVS
ncbi:MAG: hypothetical protein P9L88_06430 [Candidatus Tantalella remota]|nr:hypothetical protein [Candidatus Tantalella remota]